jgi:ERCC4-type nuclease
MISKDKDEQKKIDKHKRRINKILESFVNDVIVLVDQQEKENSHILDYFKKICVNYEITHLNTGDYSFIYDKTNFSDYFALERKNGIQELISSLFAGRFEREILRGQELLQFSIFIEDGSLNDLLVGNYRIKPNPDRYKDVNKKIKDTKQCIRTMMYSRMTEYNLQFNFIENKWLSGQFILGNIKYFLRNFMLTHL